MYFLLTSSLINKANGPKDCIHLKSHGPQPNLLRIKPASFPFSGINSGKNMPCCGYDFDLVLCRTVIELIVHVLCCDQNIKR